MPNKREIVLMDVKTSNIKIYESMSSLAKEYNLKTATITSYIKRKSVFRKQYMIFYREDFDKSWKEPLPLHIRPIKINIYTIDGEYIKTVNNLKELKQFMLDKYYDSNPMKWSTSYNDIYHIIGREDRRIHDYMFRFYDDNENCNDIEPYKHGAAGGKNDVIVMYDIEGNILGIFNSIREAADKCKGKISYLSIQRLLTGKRYSCNGYIFKRESVSKYDELINRKNETISKASLLDYKGEIMSSNLSDELKDKLIRFLEW